MDALVSVVVAVLLLIMYFAAAGRHGATRTEVTMRRWNPPRRLREMGPFDDELIVALVATVLLLGILFFASR